MKKNNISTTLAPLIKAIIKDDFELFTHLVSSLALSNDDIVVLLCKAIFCHRIRFIEFFFNTTTVARFQPDMLTPFILSEAVCSGITSLVMQVLTCSQGLEAEKAKKFLLTRYKSEKFYTNALGLAVMSGHMEIIKLLLDFEPDLLTQADNDFQDIQYFIYLCLTFKKSMALVNEIISLLASYISDSNEKFVFLEVSAKIFYFVKNNPCMSVPMLSLASFMAEQQKLGTLNQLEANYNEIKKTVLSKIAHIRDLANPLIIIPESYVSERLIELAMLGDVLSIPEMVNFYLCTTLNAAPIHDYITVFLRLEPVEDDVWINCIETLFIHIQSAHDQFKFCYCLSFLALSYNKLKATAHLLELMSNTMNTLMKELNLPAEKLPFFNGNLEAEILPVIDNMVIFSAPESEKSTRELFKELIFEPIRLAIENGHLELALCFFKMAGKKIIDVNYDGKNYLHFLIESPTENVTLILCVQLLIDYGINAYAQIEDSNCFQYAMAKGKSETAKLILHANPALAPGLDQILVESGVNSLFSVSGLNPPNKSLVGTIIDAYFDIDNKISCCFFFLIMQTENFDSEFVLFLLEKLNTYYQKKYHTATNKQNISLKRILITAENLVKIYKKISKKDAKIAFNPIDRFQCLKICLTNNLLYSALSLITIERKISYTREYKLLLLNLLVSSCSNEIKPAMLLFQCFAKDINPLARNAKGENILDLAVKYGSAIFVKLLVKRFPELINEKKDGKIESCFYLIDENSSLTKTAEKIEYYVNGFATNLAKYNCYEFLTHACQIYFKTDIISHFIVNKMAQLYSEMEAKSSPKQKVIKKSMVIELPQRIANYLAELSSDKKACLLFAISEDSSLGLSTDETIIKAALELGLFEFAYVYLKRRTDIRTFSVNLLCAFSNTKCRDKSKLTLMLNYLIQHGLALETKDNKMEDYLNSAIKQGNATLVNILLNHVPKTLDFSNSKNIELYKRVIEIKPLEDKRAMIAELLIHADNIKQMREFFPSAFNTFLFSHDVATEYLCSLANELKLNMEAISYKFRTKNEKMNIAYNYAILQGWKNVVTYLINMGALITERQLTIAAKFKHAELLYFLFVEFFNKKELTLSEYETILTKHKDDLIEINFSNLLSLLQAKKVTKQVSAADVLVTVEPVENKALEQATPTIKQEESITIIETIPTQLSMPCEKQSLEHEMNILKQDCIAIINDLSAMIQSPDRVRIYNRILHDKTHMSEEVYDQFAKFYANAKIMVESKNNIKKKLYTKISFDRLRTDLITLRTNLIKADDKVEHVQKKSKELKPALQHVKVKTEKGLAFKIAKPIEQKPIIKKQNAVLAPVASEQKTAISHESKSSETRYIDHQMAEYMRGDFRREPEKIDPVHEQTLRYLQMAADLSITFIGYKTEKQQQKSIFFNIAKYVLLRLLVCLRVEQSSSIFIILRDAFCHPEKHADQEQVEQTIFELLNDCNELYSILKKRAGEKFLTKREETRYLQQILSCSEAAKDILYNWSIQAHKKKLHLYSINEVLDSLTMCCKDFQAFLNKPEIIQLIKETLHNEAAQMISMELGSHITSLKENIFLVQETINKNKIIGLRDFWYDGIIPSFNSKLKEMRIRICHDILGDHGVTMEKQIAEWFLLQLRGKKPDAYFFTPGGGFVFYDYLNKLIHHVENIKMMIKEPEQNFGPMMI